MTTPSRVCGVMLVSAGLVGCAPPAPQASSLQQSSPVFTAAPTPGFSPVTRGGASLAVPLRRSPANTQAVPTGGGAVRGAFASGFREAF